MAGGEEGNKEPVVLQGEQGGSRAAAGSCSRGCGWRLSHKGQIHGAERGCVAQHTASIMGPGGQPWAASHPLSIKVLL